MTPAELLAKVQRIEIKTRKITDQVFAGSYHSAFRGRGMSFAEVREYQYGDDVRTLDWNVTARYDAPFVKVFEEERELTTLLLVDISCSTLFGSAPTPAGEALLKHDFIAEMGSVLAFSAIQNNDKVGVVFFSGKVEGYIQPRKGRNHFLRIVRDLVSVAPSGSATNLADALRYVDNMLSKRAVLFVVSDFAALPDYQDALRIAARRHDVVGLHIWDAHEASLPNVGLLPVLDSETNRLQWLDTADAAVRRQHAAVFQQSLAQAKDTFMRANADFVSLCIQKPYLAALRTLFERRRH